MDTIGKQKIWSYFDEKTEAIVAKNKDIRLGKGHLVLSYLELANKIAELQFLNRDYVLLFRGQRSDHKNTSGNSSLKPSLFRTLSSGNPSAGLLLSRFKILKEAEDALARHYARAGFIGRERLLRHRILRWAILQHYEICETPLLDVTHSLRIAASFAALGSKKEAFLYVLGVPSLSGAIAASAEAGLQTVRLSSVCPPSAVRPHIQEGYLLGEYPEMAEYDQKQHYFHYEIDFGRRLVAKFRFKPLSFWKDNNFPSVGKEALYPSVRQDPISEMANHIKVEIGR